MPTPENTPTSYFHCKLLQRVVNLLLESTPTQQTIPKQYVAACIAMKSVVYVWAYCTLYCVCVITSRDTRAAAAEADAIRKQQLKQMQLGTAAEADAIREQQLKQMQLGTAVGVNSFGCSSV